MTQLYDRTSDAISLDSEPRRTDLSQFLFNGQGCPNPSSSPGPSARNAMAAS